MAMTKNRQRIRVIARAIQARRRHRETMDIALELAARQKAGGTIKPRDIDRLMRAIDTATIHQAEALDEAIALLAEDVAGEEADRFLAYVDKKTEG